MHILNLFRKRKINESTSYPYVDLKLPSGTKWATMNIGAEKETDYGLYFAWGETQGYSGITDEKKFNWNDYKFGTSLNLTKYNSTDGLTTLEPSDDAATVNWGGKWKMPTLEQINELLDESNCTCEWVENYNDSKINGVLLISIRNGKKLFIPAAGSCYGSSFFHTGKGFDIWSCDLSSYGNDVAQTFFGQSGGAFGHGDGYRYIGYPVRPVFD